MKFIFLKQKKCDTRPLERLTSTLSEWYGENVVSLSSVRDAGQLIPRPFFTIILILIVIASSLFFCFGNFYSDNAYADKLIRTENIKTPYDAFRYIIDNKTPAGLGAPISSGDSFIELIERNDGKLWCDEGSIVLAVLIQRLGYKTRLVDLLDSGGLSRHTILQVLINDVWVVFNFSGRSTGGNPLDAVEFNANIRLRIFPDSFQFLLLNNFYIRKSFQILRPFFYKTRSIFVKP